jgi:hypothetical protein
MHFVRHAATVSENSESPYYMHASVMHSSYVPTSVISTNSSEMTTTIKSIQPMRLTDDGEEVVTLQGMAFE